MNGRVVMSTIHVKSKVKPPLKQQALPAPVLSDQYPVQEEMVNLTPVKQERKFASSSMPERAPEQKPFIRQSPTQVQGNFQGQSQGNFQGQSQENPHGQYPVNSHGQHQGNPHGQYQANSQSQYQANSQGNSQGHQGNSQGQFQGNSQGQYQGNSQFQTQSQNQFQQQNQGQNFQGQFQGQNSQGQFQGQSSQGQFQGQSSQGQYQGQNSQTQFQGQNQQTQRGPSPKEEQEPRQYYQPKQRGKVIHQKYPPPTPVEGLSGHHSKWPAIKTIKMANGETCGIKVQSPR
jgi:hypothetical protein